MDKNDIAIRRTIKALDEINESTEQTAVSVESIKSEITACAKDSTLQKVAQDSTLQNVVTEIKNVATAIEKSKPTEKDKEIDDKKKLAEMYLIISGLLFTGMQASIAITTSAVNLSDNKSEVLHKFVEPQIPFINEMFAMLILLILLYYTLLSKKDEIPKNMARSVSFIFGFIFVIFIDSQQAIGISTIPDKIDIYLMIGWALISIPLAFTLLPKDTDIKIKRDNLLKLALWVLLGIVFLYVRFLVLFNQGLYH